MPPLDGDLMFDLYGRHVRTWVNSLGAEWRNELQIGGEMLVSTSLFQPLDVAHRFFVEPRRLYLPLARGSVSSMTNAWRATPSRMPSVQLDVGINIGRYAQARIGYVYDDRDVNVDIGSDSCPKAAPSDAGLQVSAEFDSRDTASTRRAAWRSPSSTCAATTLWAPIATGSAPSSASVWRCRFAATCLWVTVAGGTALGSDLPADRAFALGGPGSFPGFELGELRVG